MKQAGLHGIQNRLQCDVVTGVGVCAIERVVCVWLGWGEEEQGGCILAAFKCML